MYAGEADQQNLKLKHYADVHSLPAQRYFNLLCMAYGADPKLFAYVVDKSFLPKERAETCDEEYQQIAYAFERLIIPHMDEKLRTTIQAQSKSEQWLKLKLP